MKKITILMMASLLLFLPNVFSQEETYTKEQYIAMLPTLNKIDLSKMPVLNSSDIQELSHRTWYLAPLNATEDILHNVGIESTPTPLHYVTCIYVWNMPDDLELILVTWNGTTNQVQRVFWIVYGVGFIFDYPKTIADYSIKDLPLIKTITIYDFTPYIIIVGCLIAVVAYLSKDLEI